MRLPRHGTVVLFSDFLSPLDEIQALIGRFAAVPVTGYLLQILDPAETALPYQGRIRFRGLERDGDALIPRVESVRDAYAERLKAQQDGLASICTTAGFGFGVHRTDHPPEMALLTLYQALAADDLAAALSPWPDSAISPRPRHRTLPLGTSDDLRRPLGLARPAGPAAAVVAAARHPAGAALAKSSPPIRFLLGLNATEETPARTPWWLLALRLLAAGLVIVALARPVLDAGTALAGKGPVLLVMDNGWASADDWVAPQGSRRRAAGPRRTRRPQGRPADHRAGRQRRPDRGLRHHAGRRPARPPRRDAAAALAVRSRRRRRCHAHWHADAGADNADASVIYVPDGLTDGADFARFAAALRDAGPVTEICCDTGVRAGCCCRPPARPTASSRTSRRRPQPPPPRPVVLAAERRRPHPGPHQHHHAGRRLRRLRPHPAAAGTAQPADPAGAGRPAQRRLRRAAG